MNLIKIFKEHGVELSDELSQAITEAHKLALDGTIPRKVLDKNVAKYYKLEEDYTTLKSEFDVFKETSKTTDIDEIKANNEELSNKLFTFKMDNWAEVSEKLKSDANKAKFEKIKDDFIIKEKPEDYTLDDIEKNIAEYKRYDKIDYFSSNTKINEKKPGSSENKQGYFNPYIAQLGKTIKE